VTAPPSPDPEDLPALTAVLRQLATAVDAQRLVAMTNSLETPWVSPAADSARDRWAEADGRARTGADELRTVADHLDALATSGHDVPTPPMTWPAQRPHGDPGPSAPDGVVIVMPEWTAALAQIWQAGATTIAAGLSHVRQTASAFTSGPPVSAILERALGPRSNTALAAEHYRAAAGIAAAEATGQL
jgi:hypothetical protein